MNDSIASACESFSAMKKYLRILVLAPSLGNSSALTAEPFIDGALGNCLLCASLKQSGLSKEKSGKCNKEEFISQFENEIKTDSKSGSMAKD